MAKKEQNIMLLQEVVGQLRKLNAISVRDRLREAEDLDFIKDKSDEDDIYEFTSRSLMKEIRNFSVKKKGDSDITVSQIVKEYNDRIINYFYEIDDFDIQKLDINLLISLANRSFENNFYIEISKLVPAGSKYIFTSVVIQEHIITTTDEDTLSKLYRSRCDTNPSPHFS